MEKCCDKRSIRECFFKDELREEFRGFEDLVEKVKKKPNVELVLNSVVEKFEGNDSLKAVVIKNVKTEETRKLEVDGTFIQIGYETKTDWVKDFVKLDEYGQIVVNDKCETFYPRTNEIRPGVFVAGDVTSVPFKQVVVAAGEGCKHGIKAPFLVEWGKK